MGIVVALQVTLELNSACATGLDDAGWLRRATQVPRNLRAGPLWSSWGLSVACPVPLAPAAVMHETSSAGPNSATAGREKSPDFLAQFAAGTSKLSPATADWMFRDESIRDPRAAPEERKYHTVVFDQLRIVDWL